jgi:hypothetical protein
MPMCAAAKDVVTNFSACDEPASYMELARSPQLLSVLKINTLALRPPFTTRVEQSSCHGELTFSATTISYARFIPIGGASMALSNPLPTTTGCSGSCHELHSEILQKNYTVEGYVRIPRPMGPRLCGRFPV